MEEYNTAAQVDAMGDDELNEMIELLEDWNDRTDTKFHIYKPTPMAARFHASPAKIRAKFGGNRSSKTYSHMIEFAAQFCGEEPLSLQGVFPKYRLDPTRRNRLCMADYPNSFQKVIWPYVQQLIPADKVFKVNKEQGRIKSIINKQGGFIEFMQYDQDVSKFMGSSRHTIGYDEEPPQDIRKENLMRLVDTDGEETFSLTPVSGAVKYLYDDIYLKRGREVERLWEMVTDEKGRLIDAIPGEVRDVMIPGGNPHIHAFFSCIFDNPVINTQAALQFLDMFPGEERVMRAQGKFMFLGGLVYKEYSDTTHLIPIFDDWHNPKTSQHYSLYIAIDPHPRTPHAVLFMVVDHNDTAYVVDEIFEACRADELVEKIKAKCQGVIPEAILIDPIASTPDPSTKSCLAWDLILHGLDNPAPFPGSKDMTRGIIMTRQALDTSGGLKPKVYVTENCTRFRYEIARYAWDDWKVNEAMKKGEKQDPMKKDDHMMENLRRLILHKPIWQHQDEASDTAKITMANGRNPRTGY